MKKVLVIAAVLAMLVSAFAICVGAEEASLGTINIGYGDKEVQIKLVESFDESALNPNDPNVYGQCEIKDGDIAAPMLNAAGTLNGAKYVVISMTNESDGEIWFCFQPEVPGYSDPVYMGGEMELNLYLVSKDGTVEVIDEPAAGPAVDLARYGYGIPEGFDGYLFMPSSIFCVLNQWDTPIFNNDDPAFRNVGFNVNGNDSSFYSVIIHDIYICTNELPEYVPEATEAPTAAPTEAPTEAPTSAPTEAPTDAPVVTEAPKTTNAPKTDDNAPKKNNGWLIPVIIGGVVVIAAVIAAVVAASKKKKIA